MIFSTLLVMSVRIGKKWGVTVIGVDFLLGMIKYSQDPVVKMQVGYYF